VKERPRPKVPPSSPWLLLAAGVVGGFAGWVLFDKFYGSIPPLSLPAAVTLVVLAVVEGIVAFTTRRRIDRKPGTVPVNPLAVARFVLVAKASAAAGAIFTGLYAGAFVWLLRERTQFPAAANDVVPAGAGLFGAVLLLAAALWLEHSCRIPEQPEDDES
jgi:uncharacterized protein DUF3180